MSTAHRPILACVLAVLAAGCVLAPGTLRDERQRASAAGHAWERPAAERTLPSLPAAPDWPEVLQHAFLANGDLEAAWFEWRAALDRVAIEAGWPNTNLAVSYEYLFSGGSMKAWDRSTLRVAPDPMQNLSFPTKTWAAGEVAVEAAMAAGRRFEAMKFDLQRRVLSAWHEYALLGEKLRLQQATVDILGLTAASARGRVVAGAPQQELLRAEVDLGLGQDALRRLEAEVPAARARLNALIGRAADSPLAPPEALPPARPLPADDARLLAVAADANPELQALAHDVESRRAGVGRARQEFIPDLNPFAGFTGGIAQVAGIMASLPIRVPIVLGMIREARALLGRAEATQRQAMRDRSADLVATLAALHDLDRQAALVETTLLPAAARAARNARAGYETGGLDVGELAEAERVVLELRLLAAEARTSREVRLAEVEALAGLDVETLAPAPGGSPS